MALYRTQGDIPKGAIKLEENQIGYYRWMQIKNWPNTKDVWSFHIGIPFLSGLAGLTSFRINNHFRKLLLLRREGLFMTQMATGLPPIFFSTYGHIMFVTDKIFTDEKCLVCLQTNAFWLQMFGGIVYPFMISPVVNCIFALRHGTYRLPDWTEPKETLKMWIQFAKPTRRRIAIIAVIQGLAAITCTYYEKKQLIGMQEKLESGEVELPPIVLS